MSPIRTNPDNLPRDRRMNEFVACRVIVLLIGQVGGQALLLIERDTNGKAQMPVCCVRIRLAVVIGCAVGTRGSWDVWVLHYYVTKRGVRFGNGSCMQVI